MAGVYTVHLVHTGCGHTYQAWDPTTGCHLALPQPLVWDRPHRTTRSTYWAMRNVLLCSILCQLMPYRVHSEQYNAFESWL